MVAGSVRLGKRAVVGNGEVVKHDAIRATIDEGMVDLQHAEEASGSGAVSAGRQGADGQSNLGSRARDALILGLEEREDVLIRRRECAFEDQMFHLWGMGTSGVGSQHDLVEAAILGSIVNEDSAKGSVVFDQAIPCLSHLIDVDRGTRGKGTTENLADAIRCVVAGLREQDALLHRRGTEDVLHGGVKGRSRRQAELGQVVAGEKSIVGITGGPGEGCASGAGVDLARTLDHLSETSFAGCRGRRCGYL